ncbi:BrnT family toxin [Candidatus Entotheonella palauensis]|uniref:BrnT family toxin n=1 Tax=Candidatus Entotheonella gemina TaxID=1429439 RepID=W4MGG2_9BACT|nr:BrnT family toxin [Candidatus Entotheonella palauensis]ETX09026.1 MAG: hypothetical protein ETSY2_01905 [Candidatus Entotheonella gemina]
MIIIQTLAFDWDDRNRDKCQKHGLTLDEIDAFFRQDRLYIAPAIKHTEDEQRLLAVGRSPLNGHPMFVVFTLRGDEEARLIRPISARYMHEREARRYGEEESTGIEE